MEVWKNCNFVPKASQSSLSFNMGYWCCASEGCFMHVRILVYWLGISEVKGFCYSPSIGKTSLLTINMWSTITKAAYTKTKHTNWKGLLPRCKKNLDTGWHHHDIESVKSNGRHLQNTIRSLKTWSHRNSKIFLTVILLILPLYQLTPIRNSFLTHIIFFLTGAGFCFFFLLLISSRHVIHVLQNWWWYPSKLYFSRFSTKG